MSDLCGKHHPSKTTCRYSRQSCTYRLLSSTDDARRDMAWCWHDSKSPTWHVIYNDGLNTSLLCTDEAKATLPFKLIKMAYKWLGTDEAKAILFISTHLFPTWHVTEFWQYKSHSHHIRSTRTHSATSNPLHEDTTTIARSLIGGFLQTRSVDVINRLCHKRPRESANYTIVQVRTLLKHRQAPGEYGGQDGQFYSSDAESAEFQQDVRDTDPTDLIRTSTSK